MDDESILVKSNVFKVGNTPTQITIDIQLPFKQKKNNNILIGRVFNMYYNNYIKDAVVKINNIDNNYTDEKITNEYGEYMFQNIDLGRYKITVVIRNRLSFYSYIQIGKKMVYFSNFKLCIKFIE